MKAIFIDVVNREIKEVEIRNRLVDFYTLLKCRLVAAPSFDDRHDVIVDDEGLLKETFIGFFEIDDPKFGNTYAGNGLIVRVNDEGRWLSHKLDIEEVKKKIHFVQYIRILGVVMKVRLT